MLTHHAPSTVQQKEPQPWPHEMDVDRMNPAPRIFKEGAFVQPHIDKQQRVTVAARIRNLLNAVAGYTITNLTSMAAFVLFRILNRTKTYGRNKVGQERNTLILANHRTMIDSYLIGHLTSWPWSLLKPYVLPYHPAAEENFYRNKVIGWFSARWKCLPVRRGVRDFRALAMMTEALPSSHMVIFPEGGRSRTGELLRGRPGTGKLIRDTHCKAVPCYVRGMNNVLPIGKARPRLFNKISLIFGNPISFDDLYALPDCKETSQKFIDRVMDHVATLRDELDAIEAAQEQRRRARRTNIQRIVGLPAQLLRRISS
ncbi:MAG: 1-acyl-sn-glycerol-3-phosphate acyltransferase [Deltaproteobacteria bacterium]|nr:1-acyl-sn-glycerol-3-phosphate acyltransferase [Deltaproteobacteria bacterium]